MGYSILNHLRTKALHVPSVGSTVSFLLLLIAGCNGVPSEASRAVEEVGAETLLHAAESLLHGRDEDVQGDIPPAAWPDSFRRLQPTRVSPFMYGVLVITDGDGREERGIYIVTDPEGVPPDEGSGFSVEPLDERIYWIEQKVRQPVRQLHESTDHAGGPEE